MTGQDAEKLSTGPIYCSVTKNDTSSNPRQREEPLVTEDSRVISRRAPSHIL